MSWPLFVGRRATRWVAGVLGAVALLGFLTGGLLRVHSETTLHSFLPSNDPAVSSYDHLAREFGGDPIVVLLEKRGKDGVPLDESLARLEGVLSGLPDVAGVYGPGTLLNQIAGGAQDFLAELFGRRDAIIATAKAEALRKGATKEEAAAAGRKAQLRFDARYGPLIVQGLPGGAPTLKNRQFVQKVVFDEAGRPRPQWRFVVPSRNAVAILVRPVDRIDAAATARLVRRVDESVRRGAPNGTRATVSGVPVLVVAMSEAASDGVLKLGSIAVALVALLLGFATWIRRSRRWAPLAVTLTSMSFTVAALGWLDRPLSLGVIAFATVMLGLGCYYPSYFAVGARARTVLVVAAATAASLATMALSPIPLVRELGTGLGIGVVFAAAFSYPLRGWLAGGRTDLETRIPVRGRPRWAPVALVLAVAIAVLGWIHLSDLEVRSDINEFAGGLGAYRQAQHVVDEIGSSSELDIVLRGPDTLSPDALGWLDRVQDLAISAHGDRLRPVISAPSLLRFLGSNATAEQVDSAMRILPAYLTKAAVTPDRSSAIISFGVRIEDLPQLRAARDDLARTLPPPPVGYTSQVTGLPVVAMKAEDKIAADRLTSNLLGILVSAGVLALGLRRRSDAARALLAGGVATGLGFFLLWLTGTHLNPITAALGALTAAVGCEFTIVLSEATRSGQRLLRRSVLIGAATSVAGYSVLIASDLGAVGNLGVVLSVAVLLALGSSWLVAAATAADVRPDTVPPIMPVPEAAPENPRQGQEEIANA